MSNIKRHTDRTRGPQARAAARKRRSERQARERLATVTERAYLALIEQAAR